MHYFIRNKVQLGEKKIAFSQYLGNKPLPEGKTIFQRKGSKYIIHFVVVFIFIKLGYH